MKKGQTDEGQIIGQVPEATKNGATRMSFGWKFDALLKGCTEMASPPLGAASNLSLQASGARENLPQLILVALHATNLGQLLKDVPFFFVRKTLLERSLFVAHTLGSSGATWR